MLEGIHVGGWEGHHNPVPIETPLPPLQPPRALGPLRCGQMQLQPGAGPAADVS